VDGDGARPDLLRPDPGEIDRRSAGHPRRLHGVRAEWCPQADQLDARR
jgi:hypothetical protein